METFVILAGGLGTRFKEVDQDISKIVFPVLQKPFISFIIDSINSTKVNSKIIVSLNKEDKEVERIISHTYPEVEFLIEDERLGTGGAVQYAFKNLKLNCLNIINGDSFVEIDWSLFLSYKTTTIALVKKEMTINQNQKGNVEVSNDIISSFKEKSDELSSFINAGIYRVYHNEIESCFREGPWSIERDFLAQREGIKAYILNSSLYDIGTSEGLKHFEDYLRKLSMSSEPNP
ncbi:MAG: hypothetical protein GY909_06345 [Oligoflexia bacterium]|nr:hypothetical protein [Oligoflexia bacterium]